MTLTISTFTVEGLLLVQPEKAQAEGPYQPMIAAGKYHTVGLKADGTVVATGLNSHNQCNVSHWTDIQQVAAGEYHTVGMKTDGTVVATGANDDGQCDVSEWTNIIQVAAGVGHTVGLKTDGTVVATGANDDGQCDISEWTNIKQVAAGVGHTVGLKTDGTVIASGRDVWSQCNVEMWADIQYISAEYDHTVGIKSDGTMIATGFNFWDQCDLNWWTDIKQVATGNRHTVGLKADGTVVAVGDNNHGQCDVENWKHIQQIAAGKYYTIGLKNNGKVVVSGANNNEQCDVESWADIRQVAAGAYHTAGLKNDRTVVAVGKNDSGQCSVTSWTDIQQIALGGYHTVGLKSNGIVVAVGENNFGQCNVGSWEDIQQVAAGEYHTVGLKTDGTVVATGDNSDGKCNIGSWVNIEQVAAGDNYTVGLATNGTVNIVGADSYWQWVIEDWQDIDQVAAGGHHTLGLKFDGTVVARCDERLHNYHQCVVYTWKDIQQVAGGEFHTVGLKTDGNTVATGYNDYGQCEVERWSDIQQISAGVNHTIGLKANGTVIAAGPSMVLAGWDLDGIVHVNAAALGANDGTGWGNAYTKLQEALANAGTPCQIWVAAGTYTPAPPGQPGTRTDSFQMKNGVEIYGGFPSTGSPVWSDRDWQTHRTVLSGDIGVLGDNSDNCYHVFDNSSVDTTAVLDGFTITGGNADGFTTWVDSWGGAMYNHSNSSPTVNNCVFYQNRALIWGAAMYNHQSSPKVTNCIFWENQADDGAGMYNFESSPVVTNCTLYGNLANINGGGICNTASAPIVTNCIFWENIPNEIHNEGSWPVLTHSDVQGSYPGIGNIDADPFFVNHDSGNFHLRPNSPCINTGTNSAPGMPPTDFEGDARIIDGRVDMGVDEAGSFEIVIDPSDGTICSEVTISGYNFWLTPGTESIITSDITIGGELLVSSGSVMAAQTNLDDDGLADDFRVSAFVSRTHDGGIWQVACQDLANPEEPWATMTFEIDQKTVTVTPLAGPPGTNVTIEGTGWCPGDKNGFAIMMYGNTTAGAQITTMPIHVDDQGCFIVQGRIPWEATPGVHGVMVVFDDDGVFNQSAEEISAQGTFIVTDRTLTMVPDTIPFGTQVTLSGARFGPPAAGGTPALYVNGQYQPMEGIDDQPLSSSGHIVPVTFRISRDLGFHYGENIVEIRAMVNDVEASAVADLNVVRPTLEIDPSRGPIGTTVTITGEGWPIDNFVTISYERTDTHESEELAITQPNQSGQLFVQFDVPSLDMISDEVDLLISASDGTGPESNQSLVSVYTVGPSISVHPAISGTAKPVKVCGIGFDPNSQVQEVTIGNKPIVPEPELPVTTATGSFTMIGTVPGLPAGNHQVKVRVNQTEDKPITTSFTVMNRAYVNSSTNGGNNGTSWADAYTNLQQALSNVGSPCEIWVAAGTYTPAPPGRSGTRSDSFQLQNGMEIYGGFSNTGSPCWADRDWETFQTVLSGEIGNPGTKADNCWHVFYHSQLYLDKTAVLDGFTIIGANADGGYYVYDDNGGGMFNWNSSPTLMNCTFSDNSADDSGGGMFNWSSSPTLTNCTFSGNSAGDDGGGMYNSNSSSTLTNCIFSDNSADDDGGGMYNRDSFPTLNNCVFNNNSAADEGGGILNYSSSPSPTLTNCLLNGNSANRGGGMYNSTSSVTLNNCIFSGNWANLEGGGLMNHYSSPTLINCILWGDVAGWSGDEIYDDGADTAVSYCDVGQAGYSGSNGNISQDPLWVNPGSEDFHLLPNSPCIDAGTNLASNLPAEDFEGDPRIINGRVDIGVDEWTCWFYDKNLDDTINYREMVNALTDYVGGDISYSQMIGVLMLYLTT